MADPGMANMGAFAKRIDSWPVIILHTNSNAVGAYVAWLFLIRWAGINAYPAGKASRLVAIVKPGIQSTICHDVPSINRGEMGHQAVQHL